jgi:hypothetical protein
MWPPDEDLLVAWRQLVADPDTAGAFAELVLGPLETDLARRFRQADPDQVCEAAGTAVLFLVKNSTRYDPSRSPLPAFLRLVAGRDLRNLRQAEYRRRRKQIPWDAVEHDLPAGNDSEEDFTMDDYPTFQAAVAELDEADRRAVELMRDGERDTDVFAEVFGVADRPADERKAIVKREKDRIKARLKRRVS